MHNKFLYIVIVLAINFQVVYSQVIFEAEDATFSSGKIDDKHSGFTGDGFVDTENNQGEFIEWNIHSLKAVNDSIGFRYALGKDELRSMQIYLNNELIDTVVFDSTGNFTDYLYKYTVGQIVEGSNSIKLVAINEFGAPNMDHLTAKTDTNINLPLNVSIIGNGAVTQNPSSSEITYGTRIRLSAEPDTGYSFKSWSGDKNTTKNSITFTVDKEYNLTANFKNNQRAFPGAEGYGVNTTGGRGGEVIEVTNLNDSGTGSLRAAIDYPGARTVVFRVSGTIMLNSTLSIKNDNITIAGQTAPGDGITLGGFTLKIDADNVIIRYIRSRLGDTKGAQDDAINCRKHKNIIIDHCTFSWSVDEVASFYDNENFTMQYCVVSEALYNSIHDKGKHSYGGIWGGQGATFHHNLLANNTSRNPRFCGSRYSNQPDLENVDFRNNVVFNWGFNSVYGGEGGNYNLVNNYYKDGPATGSNVRMRIIAPNPSDDGNNQPAGVWGLFYVNGNHVNASETVTNNNWAGVSTDADKNEILTNTEFSFDSVTTHTALLAYEHVLAQVGAVLPKRDAIDTRVINEVISGSPAFGKSYGAGTGIIDSQQEVGGWPDLESTTPPTDTDKDGMPDDWEDANGLDKNNPADRNDDANDDGYTNLETYLNSLVEDYNYLLRPLNFEIESENNLEVNLQWNDSNEDEVSFKLERKAQGEDYELIAEITDNSYTDVLPEYGTYTYRLASINSDFQSLYTDTVAIEVKTSLNSSQSNQFRLYPNPVKHTLKLDFNRDALGAQIKIFALLGNTIWYNDWVSSKNININMNDFPEGVYVLQVSSGSMNEFHKIIKE